MSQHNCQCRLGRTNTSAASIKERLWIAKLAGGLGTYLLIILPLPARAVVARAATLPSGAVVAGTATRLDLHVILNHSVSSAATSGALWWIYFVFPLPAGAVVTRAATLPSRAVVARAAALPARAVVTRTATRLNLHLILNRSVSSAARLDGQTAVERLTVLR